MIQYYMDAAFLMAVGWIFVIFMLKSTEKKTETTFFDNILISLKNIIFFIVVGDIIWGATFVFSATDDIISTAIHASAMKMVALNTIIFVLLLIVYFAQVVYQIVMLFWDYIKKTYGE